MATRTISPASPPKAPARPLVAVRKYAGRWGLRGDYRFIGVRSKNDAPAFFGQETRYGHRVYGAVLINSGR